MDRLELQLEGSWILQHRMDEVMPVSKTSNFLKTQYGGAVTVTKETYSYIEMDVDVKAVPVDELSFRIKEFLAETYPDFKSEYFLLCALNGSSAIEPPVKAEETTEVKASKPAVKVKKETPKQSAPTADADDRNSKLNELLKQIDNLIAGGQFKSLAHEVATLAPTLLSTKTEKVFFKQRYLVSINDGCCLDEYLDLYAKLLVACGLRSESRVVMRKLLPMKPNTEDPRYELLKDIKYETARSVICIDISDWMNQVTSVEFQEFLSQLIAANGESTLMFRIPFVDKEILGNIAKALNDMLFIRQLSFPPFTNEEIGKFADKELARYGFSMNEKAWQGFFSRIREESSDGRFYGVDTIVKVVEELIYNKQLENAHHSRFDTVITQQDTAKLCNSSLVDNLSGMEMLDRLVGTESIKNRVLEIISQIDLVRKTPSMGSPCLHMRFVGNPGTGKTTVARILGKIFKEKGILRLGEFHEHSGRDFCGRYIGETAPKTMSICRSAYGSVLFIDEAYSLYREDNDRDYGKEALDTLIAEMENHRNDFVVIMAGYTKDMERLLKGNAGLASRMPYTIEFPNFTKEQLYEIFVSMCKDNIKYSDDLMTTAKDYFDNMDEEFVASKEFSNARFVRNLYERVCAKAAMRCQMDGANEIVLTKEDFERSIMDKEFLMKKRSRIGF